MTKVWGLDRYVDQYQALLAAPSGLEGIDKADLEYYEAVVSNSSGLDLDEPYLPPETAASIVDDLEDAMEGYDAATMTYTHVTGASAPEIERYQQYLREKLELEELYAGYVEKPEKLSRNVPSGGGGRSNVAEPYERWLKGFDQ